MAESEGNEPEAGSPAGEVETEATPLEEKHSAQSPSLLNEGDASGLEESVGVGDSEVKGAGEGEGAAGSVEKIKEMQLRILREKLESGKPLSAQQLRMLEEAEEGNSGSVGVLWAKNQVELADTIGCSRKSIARYLAVEGNPGAAADGRYDVVKWRNWVASRGTLKAPPKSEKEKLELSILTMTEEAQRLKLNEARGNMVDLDEAMRVLGGICATLVTEIKALRHTLAPRLAGMTVEDAMVQIDKEIKIILRDASVPAEAKKKAFWRSIAERYSSLQARLLSGSGQSDG
jgi:hypothetical protein